MKTTISSKDQIVLPAKLRQMDQIEPDRSLTSSVLIVETIAYGALLRATRAPSRGC